MRGGYPPLCDVSFAAGSSTWLSFSVPAVFFRSVFFLYSLYLITIVLCLSSDPQSPTVPSFFCWRAMIQTRVTPLSVRCLVDVVNVPSIPFSLSFLTQPCLWLLTVILLFRSLSRFYQFHDSPRLCEVDTRRSVMIRSPLDPPHGYLFLFHDVFYSYIISPVCPRPAVSDSSLLFLLACHDTDSCEKIFLRVVYRPLRISRFA